MINEKQKWFQKLGGTDMEEEIWRRPLQEGDDPESMIGQEIVIMGGLSATIIAAGIEGDEIWMQVDIVD